MKKKSPQSLKKSMIAAASGTIVVSLCCFTPILVVTLAAVGLGAFTPYLDYVLFPALILLIALTFVSYNKWRNLGCRVQNEWHAEQNAVTKKE